MVKRSNEEIQQLATLLLEALQQPVLRTPAKQAVQAGLQQAWKCVCAQHTDYSEIEKNLPAPQYTVQARAIAVMAVDWLNGDETDWQRFVDNLLKAPSK